jgi:hypothetical protein
MIIEQIAPNTPNKYKILDVNFDIFPVDSNFSVDIFA